MSLFDFYRKIRHPVVNTKPRCNVNVTDKSRYFTSNIQAGKGNIDSCSENDNYEASNRTAGKLLLNIKPKTEE